MRKADNLPPSCAVVTKSGNLNFLEPFGPVQACNGTALLFTVYREYTTIYKYSDIIYTYACHIMATCFDRKRSSSGQ